jgi:hypothetical protein
VEPVVGEQRLCLLDDTTGDAAPLIGEDRESSDRRLVYRRFVATVEIAAKTGAEDTSSGWSRWRRQGRIRRSCLTRAGDERRAIRLCGPSRFWVAPTIHKHPTLLSLIPLRPHPTP